MDIFRVSFIGHRVVDEYRQVEEELDEVIELLHRKYGFIDFNVGRNGEFDELATQAVRRFRREWEEWCELTLVEPYPVANLDIIEKSYDNVIIPTDRKCHFKAAIGERNKWLAENCDMMIVYIKRDYGGAYKCYKYAQELGVPIMNIADIQAILTNERYCGDLLMQKTFTENCITKKVKKNRGEMPKYLIRDNHPAIITHATFKMAQMEMARRGSVRKKTDSGITEQGKYSGKFALTDILVCGECGSPYRRKTYSRNGENKRVWRCLSRLEHGTEFCSDSITVDDETLKKTIVRGISKAISDKQDVLNLILSNLAYAVTGEDDTLEMYAIEKQLKTLSGIMDETMDLAASSTGDGKRFQEEMKSLSSQMVVLREQLEIIKGRIDSNKKVNEEIENIKQCLSADSLDFSEYNDVTIRRLVEYIRVMKDNSIIIVLKGGMKIQENI